MQQTLSHLLPLAQIQKLQTEPCTPGDLFCLRRIRNKRSEGRLFVNLQVLRGTQGGVGYVFSGLLLYRFLICRRRPTWHSRSRSRRRPEKKRCTKRSWGRKRKRSLKPWKSLKKYVVCRNHCNTHSLFDLMSWTFRFVLLDEINFKPKTYKEHRTEREERKVQKKQCHHCNVLSNWSTLQEHINITTSTDPWEGAHWVWGTNTSHNRSYRGQQACDRRETKHPCSRKPAGHRRTPSRSSGKWHRTGGDQICVPLVVLPPFLSFEITSLVWFSLIFGLDFSVVGLF